MLNMVRCDDDTHACRQDPTEVANFDFTLPETPSRRPTDYVSFYGTLEMRSEDDTNLLKLDIDVYPVRSIYTD